MKVKGKVNLYKYGKFIHCKRGKEEYHGENTG